MNRQYTLESIQTRTRQLRDEVKAKEQKLHTHYREIFAPPAPVGRMEAIISHISSAYSLIDGFLTGYKLLTALFGGRRRKHK